jgi:hypothetical protein
MPRTSASGLTGRQVAALAAVADVSPKSVRRYLAGASMLASSVRRIEGALRAGGLEAHVRTQAGAVAA